MSQVHSPVVGFGCLPLWLIIFLRAYKKLRKIVSFERLVVKCNASYLTIKQRWMEAWELSWLYFFPFIFYFFSSSSLSHSLSISHTVPCLDRLSFVRPLHHGNKMKYQVCSYNKIRKKRRRLNGDDGALIWATKENVITHCFTIRVSSLPQMLCCLMKKNYLCVYGKLVQQANIDDLFQSAA